MFSAAITSDRSMPIRQSANAITWSRFCEEYESTLSDAEVRYWRYAAADFDRICKPTLLDAIDETLLTAFVDALLCEGVPAAVVRWQFRRLRVALDAGRASNCGANAEAWLDRYGGK